MTDQRMNPNEAAAALKFDTAKPMMGLISSKFLVGLAQVLTFGAKKYSAHNWRNGFKYSRVYDALQRHLVAWNDNEDLDDETRMNHLDHAACELMFLREMVATRPELDDRFKLEDVKVKVNNLILEREALESFGRNAKKAQVYEEYPR